MVNIRELWYVRSLVDSSECNNNYYPISYSNNKLGV